MHPLKKAQRWLLKRGFSEFKPAADYMAELAGLPESARRGIYVHAMQEGTQFYAGLSVDVVDRYKQHLQTYGTIEQSAFLAVPEGPLEPIESDVIDDLRRINVTLLNEVDKEPLPIGQSPACDPKVGPEVSVTALGGWLNDMGSYQDLHFSSASLPGADRHERRLGELLAHRGYSDQLADFVSYFIRKVVPMASETAGLRWSLSCLAEPHREDSETALFRLTIRQPELMAVHHCKEGQGHPRQRFVFLAHAGLLDDTDIKRLQGIQGVSLLVSGFKSIKFPQFCIETDSIEAAWAVLAMPGMLYSLKMAAAHLMEGGKLMPNIAKAHCAPLCALLAARKPTHPQEATSPFPSTASDVLARPEADSAWLSNQQYAELLSLLLAKAAKGDPGAAEQLLGHANRHQYRDEGDEDLMDRLTDEAVDLQLKHPDAWRAMKALARCTNSETSAQAACSACHLRPLSGDDRLVMVREFISELRETPPPPPGGDEDDYERDLRHHSVAFQGSILAGILFTGDDEAIDLVEEAWPRLNPNAQMACFTAFPRLMTYEYLSFAFWVLGNPKTLPVIRKKILQSLDLAGGLEEPVVHRIGFNFGMAKGRNVHVIYTDSWSYFSEFAEQNEEAMRSAGEAMGDPEAIEDLLRKWRGLDEDYCSEYLPDEYFTEDDESADKA